MWFFLDFLTTKHTKYTKLRDRDGVERKDAKAQRRKVGEEKGIVGTMIADSR